MNFALRVKKNQLNGLMKNLGVLSPLNILERGYSITTHKGKAIKAYLQVKSGDQVQVRLHKGKLDCTVNEMLE